MTAPAQQQAPNGLLSSGAPAPTVDAARDDLLKVFEDKTSGLKDNTNYYEAERRPEAIGISVPREMQDLLAYVGYPRLYVDSIADRLELEGFTIGSTTEGGSGKNNDPADELWDWWQANNLDVEAPLGHTEALVHGRSYITISQADPALDLDVDPEVPIIRVESPNALYAQIDTRTRMVTQAIRAVYNDDGSEITAATLYLPLQTISWIKDGNDWAVLQQVPHNLGIVPVVPITNRTLLSDLYGTSQITPEIRSVTDAAARILMDMQGAAELMAVPQRILFGISPKEIGVDPSTGQSVYDAYMARILGFENPEGKAFQFNAAELRNYGDALDQLDRKVAAYTGLPPQYLSYNSQNPASAEAIKASEARLVKLCERKASIFGGAWEQAMRIAYKMVKGDNLPPEYYRMESVWRDPSTPTYAAKADAAAKLYANGAGIIPKERARIDMGYSIVEREDMQVWDTQDAQTLMGAYSGVRPPGAGNPASPSGSQGQSAAKPTQTVTASPQT